MAVEQGGLAMVLFSRLYLLWRRVDENTMIEQQNQGNSRAIQSIHSMVNV